MGTVIFIKRLLFQKAVSAVMIICLIYIQIKSTYSVPASREVFSLKLPVIMYHGFTEGKNVSTYVLKSDDLEKDIVYLRDMGYEFVDTKDLIDFYEAGTPLPEKPVMLTFDDGYLNNYVFAYPILQKYQAKAVISPIASRVDYQSENPDSNTAYAQLNWDQIREMSESGLCDIQNHSYNMHTIDKERKGSARVNGETEYNYRRIFYDDLKKAHNVIKATTGKSPSAYAYPFGSISAETRSLLICSGYKISFTCNEGINTLTNDKNCLFMLKRYNRTPEKSVEEFLESNSCY